MCCNGQDRSIVAVVSWLIGPLILRLGLLIVLFVPSYSLADSGALVCNQAIAAAERRHGVPAGLLLAIGRVESGVRGADGVRQPWPWAANAAGQGRWFATREAAVAWAEQMRAANAGSVDVGCMQVNLAHHPGAFASVQDGFDPVLNADYAARFLVSLHAGPAGGDWLRAAGFYHSQTPARALPYSDAVRAEFGMTVRPLPMGMPIGVPISMPVRPVPRPARLAPDPVHLLRQEAASTLTRILEQAEQARATASRSRVPSAARGG